MSSQIPNKLQDIEGFRVTDSDNDIPTRGGHDEDDDNDGDDDDDKINDVEDVVVDDG